MHQSLLSSTSHHPANEGTSPALSSSSKLGRVVTRLVWALLVMAILPTAPSCGARETNMSTKTGNPPVIDQTRVRITGVDGEVVVTGEQGAVRASEDDSVVVKVTNHSNDATATTTVDDDGSFEVRVEGALEDDYELTVTVRGSNDSASLSLSDANSGPQTCLERTGATVNEAGTRGPQPTCGTLNAEAACLATELAATVSLECDTSADCVIAPHRPDCTDSCGNGIVVSNAGADDLAAGLAGINEAVCAEFDEQGCSYLPSGCPLPPKTIAACEESQCVAKFVHNGFECSNAVLLEDTPACEDYEAEARCQRDAMLADLSNTCTIDDDCIEFTDMPECTSPDCSGSTVIAASSLADANTGLEAINAGICSGATDSACEYTGPPCNWLALNPRCVAGACVHVQAE